MRSPSPPPDPTMHGVVAPTGHTAPPSKSVRVWSDTPYWRYSTLVGGGATAACARAGRVPHKAIMTKQAPAAAPRRRLAHFRSDSVRALGISFFTGLTNDKPVV